ncbi:SLC13 family permease [Hydrogenophaga sp. PAMC20947]|uniref:SLC13 family permease n=1 Tax=Hydrogenophaga sp. PAMC20947 TaxID=2565558 RepID=UPI00109E0AC2|nr:SLC13 family permease [Hydrogenophaga sp. PAMC20947]QCB47218.1 SLC13 family permease [Hydrogenophaga sp. PAMC20947]
MQTNQLLILSILAVAVGMFAWGRWRHDMVAAGALLACVVTGLLPAREAFLGFGHPAVISVACVLILSRGLQISGAVNVLARHTLPQQAGTTVSLLALVGLGALLSGFMNNVGAMALLMPLAIQLARRLQIAPGQVLMPLAFGTILGGMTTLIGTPPNLIVSGFRAERGLGGFSMFDFTPVGLAVALAGVAFVALVGWRLVPVRKQSGLEGFETGAYLTEARVVADSSSIGKALYELDPTLDAVGAQVVGMSRDHMRVIAPYPGRRLREGDILVIEAEAESLAKLLSSLGLKLEESGHPERAAAEAPLEVDPLVAAKHPGADEAAAAATNAEAPTPNDELSKSASRDIVLMELAVRPGSLLEGRSASDIQLRTRYGLNLLAVSRHGERALKRLRLMALKPGDLLLMQGPAEALAEFASDMGCVPLAQRELQIPNVRRAWIATGIMVASVGAAALGLLPAAVAFALGVLASMAFRTVPLRAVYESIDWPVIVLLGALIPVAAVMETTGTADMIARVLLENVAQGSPVGALVLVLVVTMFLSDLINNAATAAVMCPIALGTSAALGVSADAFLMAVAIGASCAFLTPIGHQNNTLILGPGGFRFGDYWRLGLAVEVIVVAISVPMLLWIWPL